MLVKWAGTTNEDATWENERWFAHTYSAFILKGKDDFKKGADGDIM